MSEKPTTITYPSVEHIQQELATAISINDFFGKEGIFSGACGPRTPADGLYW